MKLIKYGVTLSRIREEDIELVRSWRNSPQIQKNMLYREYITPEMQLNWFKSIDNYDNFYYIIEYNNDKIGLINNKNTDRSIGTSDSGLFLYDENYFNSHVPIAASFILIEVGFYLLRGVEIKIQVLRNNKKSIDYNQKIGFEVFKDDPENDYIEFILTLESFERKTPKLKQALVQLYAKNEPLLKLTLDKYDYDIGIGQRVENEIDLLPPGIIKEKDFSGENKLLVLDY